MQDQSSRTIHDAVPAAPTEREVKLATLAHLCGLAASFTPMLATVVPVVIYLTQREQSEFVAAQAREAVNFQLNMLFLLCAATILTLVLVGWLMLPILIIGQIVMAVIAALEVSQGRSYRYPWIVRIIH